MRKAAFKLAPQSRQVLAVDPNDEVLLSTILASEKRFRNPLSRPNSGSLYLIAANSSQGLDNRGTLAEYYGSSWSVVAVSTKRAQRECISTEADQRGAVGAPPALGG